MTEVTCAIIKKGEHVVVTRRSERMPHPLKWEFPGGKLKAGESPESCIVREIREELGVEVTPYRMLSTVVHAYGPDPIRLIPFICRLAGGEIMLHEHSDYRWVDIAKLGELEWLEADRAVVRILQEM